MMLAVPAMALAACRRNPGLTHAQQAAVDQARTRAVVGEHELLARYDAALTLPEVRADQALTDRLAGIRSEHTAHLAALLEGTAAPAATTPSPTPPPDAKTTPAPLIKAEQDAADR